MHSIMIFRSKTKFFLCLKFPCEEIIIFKSIWDARCLAFYIPLKWRRAAFQSGGASQTLETINCCTSPKQALLPPPPKNKSSWVLFSHSQSVSAIHSLSCAPPAIKKKLLLSIPRNQFAKSIWLYFVRACYRQRSLIMAWTEKLRGWGRTEICHRALSPAESFLNTIAALSGAAFAFAFSLFHSFTSGRFPQVKNIRDFWSCEWKMIFRWSALW